LIFRPASTMLNHMVERGKVLGNRDDARRVHLRARRLDGLMSEVGRRRSPWSRPPSRTSAPSSSVAAPGARARASRAGSCTAAPGPADLRAHPPRAAAGRPAVRRPGDVPSTSRSPRPSRPPWTAAGGKDVNLIGANLATQAVDAGLVDEVLLHVVPLFLVRRHPAVSSGPAESCTSDWVEQSDAGGFANLRLRPARPRDQPRRSRRTTARRRLPRPRRPHPPGDASAARRRRPHGRRAGRAVRDDVRRRVEAREGAGGRRPGAANGPGPHPPLPPGGRAAGRGRRVAPVLRRLLGPPDRRARERLRAEAGE
jgi:hypothetical protein